MLCKNFLSGLFANAKSAHRWIKRSDPPRKKILCVLLANAIKVLIFLMNLKMSKYAIHIPIRPIIFLIKIPHLFGLTFFFLLNYSIIFVFFILLLFNIISTNYWYINLKFVTYFVF